MGGRAENGFLSVETGRLLRAGLPSLSIRESVSAGTLGLTASGAGFSSWVWAGEDFLGAVVFDTEAGSSLSEVRFFVAVLGVVALVAIKF
jgi:hypothetical protein